MDINKLLSEPDTVLLKNGSEVQSFLSLYTVPIAFFNGSIIDEEHYKGNGSGVLVKLNNRYFIFTAGHCIKIINESTTTNIVVNIASYKHLYTPKFDVSEFKYVPDTDIDYGFIEIPKVEADIIESRRKLFASENRLLVSTAEALNEANDWMIIAGYPDSIMVVDPESRGVRLLVYSSTVAGKGTAPKRLLPNPSSGIQAVDVWIPKHGNINTLSTKYEPVSIPLLAGISGGGCWRSHVRPDPNNWDIDKLKLVGIHIGSNYTTSNIINGEEHFFAREVLIIHILQLICVKIPELRDVLLLRWPVLAGDKGPAPLPDSGQI